MGKVLKPLAIIAAIAVNVIPGVGQVLSAAIITSITTAGITAAIGMAAGALGLGPKSPSVSNATRDRLYANIDPTTPRKLVFGRTAMATDIRYQEWTGADQEYLHQIVCVASHKVSSIDEIWLDDELAWTAAGGAQGEHAGYLAVTTVLEGTPANYVVIGDGSKWGASRRMTGLAYLHMRFKITGNGKKKESPYAQQIPSRMTIVGNGMPVYDPRFDSTAGGDGPMRADDQTTWAFQYGGVLCGRNPANQLLTYLLGWKITQPSDGTQRLAVGRGIPKQRFDFAKWITAANACDESVVLAVGGTEPRYRADGVFAESDDPRLVIEGFETSANAKLRDTGGRFGFVVLLNDLATPRLALTDADVLGEFRWNPHGEIEKRYNEIRGRFTDSRPISLYQLVDYPRWREPPTDGIERTLPFDLPLVQSGSQAQRLVKQQAQRLKYQGRFETSLGPRGWALQLGDIVTLTFSSLGWGAKLFRVVEHGIRPDGVCPVVLQEEHADIYRWDNDERPGVEPVALTDYDRNKAVLFQLLAADQLEYNDGTSLEDLQPAEPGATEGAVIPDPDGTGGNVKDTNGDPFLPGFLRNDLLEFSADGVLGFRPITGAPLLELGRVTLPDLGAASADAVTQAEQVAARLSEALVRLSIAQNETRENLRDAGVYVDPTNGEVRIYALEQTDEKVSEALVRVSGVEASISLRATVEYVNEQIALAEIGEADASNLADLIYRMGQAEIAINANAASILNKAELVQLTAVEGRVTTAEQEINALEGVVSTKVDAATYTGLETRVTTAEQEISALSDGGSISQTIQATRLLDDRADANAETALRALLNADREARTRVAAVASARQEITAKVNDDVGAEASARLQLGVRVGLAEAGLATEQTVRAAADSALSQQITVLQAQVGTDLQATIAAEQTARIDGDAALAQSITALQVTVGGNTAAITNEQTTRANADAALAQDITTVSTNLGNTNASVTTLSQTVGGIDADLDALSGSVVNLTGTVNTQGTTLAGVQARYGVRLDVNGYVTGFVQNNNGSQGNFVILADNFAILKPSGGARTEFSDGNWRIYDGAGTLRVRLGVW